MYRAAGGRDECQPRHRGAGVVQWAPEGGFRDASGCLELGLDGNMGNCLDGTHVNRDSARWDRGFTIADQATHRYLAVGQHNSV